MPRGQDDVQVYLGFLMAFWCTPTMTVTHLVLAGALTAHIPTAIRLEERDLGAVHPEYATYRRQVPMLIPRLVGNARSREEPAGSEVA
jgi:protein-S-isoprenylcysteine O-methyltransferase Ste14